MNIRNQVDQGIVGVEGADKKTGGLHILIVGSGVALKLIFETPMLYSEERHAYSYIRKCPIFYVFNTHVKTKYLKDYSTE